METWKYIIGGIVALITVAAGVEAWFKRGKSGGPLAERMDFKGFGEPQETDMPLGMEATDTRSVEESERLSRILGGNTSMIERWRKR